MSIKSTIIFGVFILTVPLTAGANGFGVGVKAGTLGIGAEGTIALVSGINLRIGANNYTYDYDTTVDNIRYDAELDLESYALLLDWHPFKGTFRLTAGLLSNRNEATLAATPTQNVIIGNTTYTPAQAGQLNGAIEFKKTAPYAGIGWGNAAGKSSGLGFSVELGALFQGAPDVMLSSTNPAVSQSDLRAEEQQIEDDLDNFKVYPVISFGISYQF